MSTIPKINKRVTYTSRKHSGAGKVTAVEHKRTGTWVTVLDAERQVFVTLRPSQLGEPT